MGRKGKGSNRFLTGMVLGIALGVIAAKMLGQAPRHAWERVFAPSRGAEEAAIAVQKVIDGDTIVTEGGERVRLVGVDAPEVGEPFCDQASDFQKKVLLDSRVRLLPCKEEGRDRYGRTLAFVRKGNVDVGEELLRHGLARTLFLGPCGRSVEPAYRKVERGAFRAARGLWSLQDPRCVSHDEAGRYIGCMMTVTGRVVKVHEGPKAFQLNFGKDYRTDFTIVIFRKDLPRLIREGLAPVTTGYRGRFVEVTGYIKDFNGPEIVVESADQLILQAG